MPANPYDELLADPEAIQAEANPYDDVVGKIEPLDERTPEEIDGEKDLRIRLAFEQSFHGQPDRRAASLKLAGAFGVSADAVEPHFDDYMKTFETAQFDVPKWRKENPVLADMLLRKPELGPTITEKREQAVLTKIAKTIGAAFDFAAEAQSYTAKLEAQNAQILGGQDVTPDPGPSPSLPDATEFYGPTAQTFRRDNVPAAGGLGGYGRGKKQLEIAELGDEAMRLVGEGKSLPPELEQRHAQLTLESLPYYNETPGFFTPAAETLPITLDTMLAGGVGGLVVGVPAAGVAGYFGGPVAARQAFVTGYGIGSRGASALRSFQIQSSLSFWEFRGQTGPDGKPVDDVTARDFAIMYGVVAASIEAATFGAEASAFGPLGDAIRKGNVKAFASSLLKDKALMSLAKDIGKRGLASVEAESTEEGLQQAASEVMSRLAIATSSGEMPDIKPSDIITPTVEAGLQAVPATLGLMPGSAAVNVATQAPGIFRERFKRGASEVGATKASAIARGLAESKTAEASPDSIAEIVAGTSAKGGEQVSSLFVDPEAVTRFFQSQNTDPAEGITQLMGEDGPRHLQEAIATGQKLEVPVAAYAAKWAKHPINEAIADQDIQTRPGYLTKRELERDDAAIEQQAKALVERFEKEEVPAESPLERQAMDEVEAQLARGAYGEENAAHVMAVTRAGFRTLAQRAGVPLEHVLHDYIVKVTNDDLRVARQKAPKGEPRVFRPTSTGLNEVVPDTSFDFGTPTEGTQPAAQPEAPVDYRPSAEAVTEARAMIGRMRGEESKRIASAWVDFAEGKGPRVEITPELERRLARFGIVDPEEGYTYGEDGRSLHRSSGSRKKRGEEPEALKRDRLERTLDISTWRGLTRYYQSAWHGSPHRFEKFTLQKMGTGEGAQAYGWGLYFAQRKETAEEYRTQLTSGRVQTPTLDTGDAPGQIARKLILDNSAFGSDKSAAGILEAARADARKQVDSAANMPKALERAKGALARLEALKPEDIDATGQTYKVEVPEDNELLDYDKPVTEQQEKVRAALATLGFSGDVSGWQMSVVGDGTDGTLNESFVYGTEQEALADAESYRSKGYQVGETMPRDWVEPATGRDVYERLTERLGSPEAASKALLAAGIPGLRFLDQGSREAGDGTYNYVVWDDNRIEVTDRLYQPAVAGLENRLDEVVEPVRLAADAPGTAMPHSVARKEILSKSKGTFPVGNGGLTIRVADEGINNSMHKRPSPATKAALLALPQVIERAMLVAEGADKKKRAEVFAARVFVAPLQIGNELYVARMLVTETAEGHGLYNLKSLSLEKKKPGGERASEPGQTSPSEPPTHTKPGPLTVRNILDGVKDEEEKLILPQLYQRLKQGDAAKNADPRGFVDIIRDGLKKTFDIHLGPQADLSTFLHENGHVFLEMMSELAIRQEASDALKKDWQTTLDWLGAKPDEKFTTEQHEKWARGFERYLMEGKAPSAELASAFQRFKIWLTQIYRKAENLDVEINDDIRGVFDRLLATDDEIARQREAMGLQPMFRSPEDAGMSPAEWEAYLAAQERATSHAARATELRLLKDKLRETERWWKDEEAKHREDARLEYDARPDVRAYEYLRTGLLTWESDSGVSRATNFDGPQKLDRKTVLDLLGVGETPKGLGGLVKDGGAHPDDAAELFDFATGKQLVEAVLGRPEREAWAKEQAVARMQEAHPDLLNERQKLAELVGKGLHGEHTQEWLLREWKALKKKTTAGGASNITDPPIEAIKRAAEMMAERRKLNQLNAGRAQQAERTAAEKAALAAAKGNYAQAYVHKQQQLLNHFMYRELSAAREAREKFLDLASSLKQPTARARLGKASPIYRDVVDTLLEALELKDVEERETQPASLQDALRLMEDTDETVGFDPEIIQRVLGSPRSAGELTVLEMRAVVDALENIRKAARNRTTALVDGKRVDKENLINELIAEASINLPAMEPLASSVPAMSIVESGISLVSSIDGELLRPETMIGWLGKGLESSWFRAIFKPLNDAKVREVDLLNSTIKPILDTMEAMPEKVRARLSEKIDGKALFPNHSTKLIKPPSFRFELLSMALNWGNEGNIQRLTEGRGITRAQGQAAIELLTKEEMDWAQSVLDAMETLWPESAALEERDSGIRPEKVRATPIVTKHGTYRGGYFPAVADRRESNVGERQAGAAAAGSLMDPTFTRPGTSRGHLKSRAKNAAYVVALDLSVIQAHLAQSVHDIAYREAVKSVGGLIQDEAIQATLKQRLGEGRARIFLQWVKDIGQTKGSEVSTHAKGFSRFLGTLKANAGVAVLGYAVDVVKGDLSNPWIALRSTPLKSKHLASGTMEFLRSPRATLDFARAKSGELRARSDSHLRAFATQAKRFERSRNAARLTYEAVVDNAFKVFEWSEMLTTTGTWVGAYRQALHEGKTDDAAVTFADYVVRKIVPANFTVDKPELLRSNAAAGLLQFHGYMNTVYNLYRDEMHPLYLAYHEEAGAKETIGNVGAALLPVSASLLGITVGVALLSEFFSGKGPEADDGEDDAERYANWAKRKMLMAPIQALPIVGAGVELATGQTNSARAAPGVGSLMELGKAIKKASNGDLDAWDRALIIAKAAGTLRGAPVNRPLRAADYLHDVATGAQEPENIFDWYSGLFYGARDNQPANPAKPLFGR